MYKTIQRTVPLTPQLHFPPDTRWDRQVCDPRSRVDQPDVPQWPPHPVDPEGRPLSPAPGSDPSPQDQPRQHLPRARQERMVRDEIMLVRRPPIAFYPKKPAEEAGTASPPRVTGCSTTTRNTLRCSLRPETRAMPSSSSRLSAG